MTQFKHVTKETDLSIIKRHRPWDVVIHGRPYYVVKLDGYVHTIGGRWGDNDYWAYPRDEEPSYENLVEFEADDPVCWGISYQPHLYTKCKWDECFVRRANSVQITRNGEVFNDFILGGIAEALAMINKYRDHPLALDEIDFDKKCIGRKVWWRSEPGVITSYVKHQACVIIEPDGIDKFTVPAEFREEEGESYYEDNSVKTSILDNHIWWFRE